MEPNITKVKKNKEEKQKQKQNYINYTIYKIQIYITWPKRKQKKNKIKIKKITWLHERPRSLKPWVLFMKLAGLVTWVLSTPSQNFNTVCLIFLIGQSHQLSLAPALFFFCYQPALFLYKNFTQNQNTFWE